MDKSTLLLEAVRAVCRQLKYWRASSEQRRTKIEPVRERKRERAECSRMFWRYRPEVQQ